jgi:hypothetical protein
MVSSAAAERRRMLPAIALLLRLSPAEVARIEAALGGGGSGGGSGGGLLGFVRKSGGALLGAARGGGAHTDG